MNIENSKNAPGYETIPVDKPMLIFLFLIMVPIVAYLCLSWPKLDLYFRIGAIIASFGTILMLFEAGRSYRLSSSGLQVYLFFVPFRKYAWCQIKQIGIAKRDDGLKGSGSPFIIITTDRAEPFDPQTDRGAYYIPANYFHVFKIPYPDKYLALIKKYYGPLDYDVRNLRG